MDKWERVPVRDGELASFVQTSAPLKEFWLRGAIVPSNGNYVFLVDGDAQADWPPIVVQALLDYYASGNRV